MYDFLSGEVAERSAARLVLDVGGVGYELLVPLGTPFPSRGGVKVWTHLAVREDAHTLYGFPDAATRDLFRLLLKVRGVGPAMALGILSGMDRESLLGAIAGGDAKTLTKVKGVGKKTAEQILLDLGERAARMLGVVVPAPRGGEAPAPAAPASADSENVEDAITALVSIGYSDKDARRLVEKAAATTDPDDLEALVRTALHS